MVDRAALRHGPKKPTKKKTMKSPRFYKQTQLNFFGFVLPNANIETSTHSCDQCRYADVDVARHPYGRRCCNTRTAAVHMRPAVVVAAQCVAFRGMAQFLTTGNADAHPTCQCATIQSAGGQVLEHANHAVHLPCRTLTIVRSARSPHEFHQPQNDCVAPCATASTYPDGRTPQ